MIHTFIHTGNLRATVFCVLDVNRLLRGKKFYVHVRSGNARLNKIKHDFFKPLNFSNPLINQCSQDFPGGAVVKNPPASAGDTGSSPGLGRSHMPRSN